MPDDTPMMQQYRTARERAGDAVLFFRLGDFYEMFERDAREVAPLLGLTLTQRNGIPMCGVPYHAVATYIARLLAAGRKVAICEQTTAPGKGLMSREVLEIVTPGTVMDDGLLDRSANNYLLAVAAVRDRIALAWTDLSTGELAATSFPAEGSGDRLARELQRLAPREVLAPESLLAGGGDLARLLGERPGTLVNRLPDWSYEPVGCRQRLERQLGVANLKGYGLAEDSPEVVAAGVLLEYLADTQQRALAHVRSISVYGDRSFLGLDEATQRNLELLTNLQDGGRRYTLMEVLDQSRTAPGARKLRRRLLTPLLDRAAIETRLEAVEALYRDQVSLARLREALAGVLDLERLASRVAMERANPKDLLAVGSTLSACLALAQFVEGKPGLAAEAAVLRELAPAMTELADLLSRAIDDEAPVVLTDGGLIRDGFDAEIDSLRAIQSDARGVLEGYLEEERRASGIGSLKLRFNRVIGYYFEVTKSNLSLVPSHFIRRQSLVGGERYSTERLAELESSISDASERLVELERARFLEVRERVRAEVPGLLALCEAVSELDVAQSFAFAATLNGWTRPRLTDDRVLAIREGRHPVVEAHLPGGSFVPNGIKLSGDGAFFVVLTGPNMAGKSTFLRQTALIVLMAQVGSFVPAAEAEVGLVDAIFCRVGATDNLARGESTFLVEMNETAHILRAATDRSLVIMDEVGRGTGTRDGLAIAWAVSLTILERVRCRTLFATHFHELTALEHAGLVNLSMDVLERAGEVVFLKRVREGPSDNSYGLHVARLAGLPEETLAEAERVLSRLIADGSTPAPVPPVPPVPARAPGPLPGPSGLSGPAALFPSEELILKEIQAFRVDRTTPLEALNRIARWKRELAGE